jgi:hypothetical protein
MDNLKTMLQQKGLQLFDLASPNYLFGHLVKIHCFWRFEDIGAETQLLEDRGFATFSAENAGPGLESSHTF